MLLIPALLLWGFFADPLLAQQSVTLTGVVRDAASGDPVIGALLFMGDRGPRAIADAEGRFRLANVPTGTQRIRVQRFGYRDVELPVTVTDPPAPLEIRMQVDPVALEGLTVTGGARVTQGGTVLNAATGEPVPWADLAITRDAVRDLERASADAQGVFSLRNVVTGPYLLRVERVGYHSQYLPVHVVAPPDAVEVRLEPDSAALAGLARLDVQLRSRTSASGSVARSFGESMLRLSRMRGMRMFLLNDGHVNLVPCRSEIAYNCRDIRGALVAPRVYIDELLVHGLEQLDTYEPAELYKVDVFDCARGDRLGGWEVRVYTYDWVERQTKRPRQLIPTCFAF